MITTFVNQLTNSLVLDEGKILDTSHYHYFNKTSKFHSFFIGFNDRYTGTNCFNDRKLNIKYKLIDFALRFSEFSICGKCSRNITIVVFVLTPRIDEKQIPVLNLAVVGCIVQDGGINPVCYNCWKRCLSIVVTKD
mgnify:CR=1 FL=1